MDCHPCDLVAAAQAERLPLKLACKLYMVSGQMSLTDKFKRVRDLGFDGIAVALLGRNSPIGIAFAALLWGFLEVSSAVLNLEGIPPEIVRIMQGTVLLSVVIAYSVVGRYQAVAEVKAAAARSAAGDVDPELAEVSE